MKYIFSLLLYSSLLLASCQQDELASWHPVDLSSYGVSASLLVPDSSALDIKTNDLGIMQDITVQDGEGYSIQIFASQAGKSSSVQKLLQEQKEEVKKHPLFSRMVEEYPDGFIFENRIDSTTTSFDFRKVKIHQGQEYIFRTGLLGIFTEEQVKKMYKAIQ